MLKQVDPWNKMLQKGIILWRHCRVQDGKITLQEVNFDRTEKGSFLGRISLTGNAGMWEPEVLSNRVDENRFTRGIAVFVATLPPKDWTHLVISGVSKPFNQPGKPTQGGCVFADIANPYELEDYQYFRERLHEAKLEDVDADIDKAIAISAEIWPDGIAKDTQRLVVQPAWVDDAHFHYEILCTK
jgi:hypothetical protein